MFAFLALAGDLGATLSPTMVGYIADLSQGNLKTGLLAASLFPVLLIAGLLWLGQKHLGKNRAGGPADGV